jgi:DNA-binding NarL/FixJ family response regulator
MKLLLVDDHVLFREGLVSLLDAQPDMTIVGEAASIKEAVAKAEKLNPDTILMDISLPDGTGLQAASQILSRQPHINIVFLTVHEDDDRLFEAIKRGGKGYLLKNMRTAELLNMLRGLERGEAAISGRMAGRIMAEFARIRPWLSEGEPDEETLLLTSRELELLQLVAEDATNKEIARRLFIAESTVKNHMRNILSKLHLNNRREAAAYAQRRGLIDSSQN